MIILMKEITNAKVFSDSQIINIFPFTYSAAPARGLFFAHRIL